MSVEHWEDFYRSGLIATCPTSADSNYTLELRDGWAEFFGSLEDGARILDIGTGNGPVALIAREIALATGKHFEIHGSDLALIDPPRQAKLPPGAFEGIVFHPGVPSERLPFDTASLDAVSGQFALEYTDIEKVLAEVFRVLSPGGRARFSVHHAESAIVDNARTSLSHTRRVIEETRIFRKLRSFVEADRAFITRQGTGAKAAEALRALNRAAEQLATEANTSANPHTLRVTLDAVQQLVEIRRRWPAARLDREIDRVEHSLRSAARRLHDLTAAARSAPQMEEIVRAAVATGFSASGPQPQLQEGRVLVGWSMVLQRPGSVGQIT